MPVNATCGEHCSGEHIHCFGPCCHGKVDPATQANEACGEHCMGYRNEDGELTAPNSRIHCRCKDCHNIPDVSVHHRDPSISFHLPAEKKPKI